MKNENNTQRPSPSSPHLVAENHLEAGEGLDVTACSASSFDLFIGDLGDNAVKMVSDMKSKYPDRKISSDIIFKYDKDQSTTFTIT